MSEVELEDIENFEPEETEEAELSVEERAKIAGWSPDGDLDAESFLNRREDNLGLMRGNLEKAEKTIAEMQKAQQEQMRMLQVMQQKARDEGYQSAMQEIKSQKARAIEEGDADAFQEAENREKQLSEERQKEEQQSEVQKKQEAARKVLEDYAAKNEDVFDTGIKAETWKKELQYQMSRGKSFAEAMDKASDVVRSQYGGKQKVPGVEEGGTRGSSGGKGWAALPKEAKESYERFSQQMPGYTKEEHAKLYWSQQ